MTRRDTGTSRVGRRIVRVFLLFALVPLVVFAVISQHRVTAELERTVAEDFHEDVKAAGFTILERLTMASDELAHLAAEGRDEDHPRTGRYLRVVRGRDADAVRDAAGVSMTPGASRLAVVPDGEAFAFWLLRPGAEGGGSIAARLDPAFVFDASGLERPPAGVGIHLPDGTAIYHLGPAAPPATVLLEGGLGRVAQGTFEWREGEAVRRGRYWQVFLRPHFGQDLVVSVHEDRARLLAPLALFKRDLLLAVLLTAALVVLASLVHIRRILRPVSDLVRASERVAARQLDARVEPRGFDEFATLGRAFNAMAADLERHGRVMEEANAFGASLSVEADPKTLILRLTRGAASMFHVDGVLVQCAGAGAGPCLQKVTIKSLGIEAPLSDVIGEDALADVTRDSPPEDAGPAVAATAMRARVKRVLGLLQETRDYDVTTSLTLPMTDHEGRVLGALTLFNPEGAPEAPGAFDRATIDVAASLAGQAAVALANARLRQEFKVLFDAMIETLATAVDEQSPYTGSHCRRVPQLAMMILDGIQTSEAPPFAHRHFDEHEVYEMQVAALLHDCGKIITPTHVIDKATKLETIYDRIHLIEQRFQTAVRTREVEDLRGAAARAGLDLTDIDDRLAQTVQRLREDRDFLRRANLGTEYMRDEDVERVKAIAQQWTWRDAEGGQRSFLTPDEQKNLCIRKGTLNDQERMVVNRHVEATMQMLARLPFPRRLRNVPRIAASHHERMDGKGFPHGLVRDEIPLQGRILAIADVFEALTATDRPYKQGKTLSAALRIMAVMARDGHLDPDVFDLFLTTGIWQRYADETLSAAQRDRVSVPDVRRIFRSETPPTRAPEPQGSIAAGRDA